MSSQVRIISGKWRGRKIKFAATASLRPTPDRVRETLFNWLGDMHDSCCLDLFAGSGALGIEALSRGAKSVAFVDETKACCDNIRDSIESMGDTPEVYNLSFENALEQLQGQKFDIIFLDPPYHTDLISKACQIILTSDLLTPHSLVYCETAKEQDICYPSELKCIKTKTYSSVTFSLLSHA